MVTYQDFKKAPGLTGHDTVSVYSRLEPDFMPLHLVSFRGDCEAIKCLVNAGANINLRGINGYTPLHCATEQNHPKAISLLLSLGAKLVEDENGNTPLSIALEQDNQNSVNALEIGI